MRISLIGQNFDENSGQGVYEYSNHLYENLKKYNKDVEKVELGISHNPFKTLFNNIFVSFFKTLKRKSDIYHFMIPEIAFPCLFKRPSVVTIHDVIPLLIKERKKSFNFYFKMMMKVALRANHFIVDSNSTKRDILSLFGVDYKKISVVYLGVDHKKFYPLKNKKKNKKFIIGYLGGLGKRKNIKFILKLAKEFGGNKKILFKIAGKGPELERLMKTKEKLNLRNTEFVSFIPEKRLNEFYNYLDLFIFPSFYEGFGLPIIEAMACGIPVMTSNRGSLPEIVGDAGILIEPNNLKESLESLKSIIKDKALQKKLRKMSIKRAKEFNWNKTAKETLEVYKKLI